MIVVPCDAPQEVLDIGVFGGNWFRAQAPTAYALLFWRGGPGSEDRDVLLHHIEATFRGSGAGTQLLLELLAWTDDRKLTVSAVCGTDLVPWYQRCGFIPVGRYMDLVEIARPPFRKGSAHTAVATEMPEWMKELRAETDAPRMPRPSRETLRRFMAQAGR